MQLTAGRCAKTDTEVRIEPAVHHGADASIKQAKQLKEERDKFLLELEELKKLLAMAGVRHRFSAECLGLLAIIHH